MKIKCPEHEKYAIHRAEVRVCPKCGYVLDADQLYRLLRELEINDKLIDQIRTRIRKRNVSIYL